MTTPSGQGFVGLVNLASESLGAKALATNDDFFAGMENLVKDAPAVFLPDEYTDRGKWMDGWESRRKRVEGHDWCVVKLGVPGVVRALDLDTSHFLGNQPPFASLEAATISDASAKADSFEGATWTEILPQGPLRPGSSNLFCVAEPKAYTHVRLNLYPDGGVARLRVFGDVAPNWDSVETNDKGEVDLVALANGGLALACSDAFFGPMNNLIAPSRSVNMGGGWETRRRQGRPFDSRPDWIVVRLGASGTISAIEVDTNHFKGNYPDRCAVDGIHLPGARITDLLASDQWKNVLPEQKLNAHEQRRFRDEISEGGPFTHARLRIFPDGGISRLRLFGRPA